MRVSFARGRLANTCTGEQWRPLMLRFGMAMNLFHRKMLQTLWSAQNDPNFLAEISVFFIDGESWKYAFDDVTRGTDE